MVAARTPERCAKPVPRLVDVNAIEEFVGARESARSMIAADRNRRYVVSALR
ncbi:MAG TPA: hypothetical protein VH482_11025 [Thermomicrobiales bacterium]|jgi:hypothetical protein